MSPSGAYPDVSGAAAAAAGVGAVIDLDGVGRRFRLGATEVIALHDVALRVDAGEFVVVLGPSGSRQVHAAQPHRRAGHPDQRAAVHRGPGHHAGASRRELFAFRRHAVSFIFQTLQPLPAAHRARERAVRRRRRGPSPTPSPAWPGGCSSASAWATACTTSRTSSPAGSSSAWRSPAPLATRQPDPARRRADRRAGLPHRRADPRAAARADPRARHGGAGRHAQPRDRAHRRPRGRALQRHGRRRRAAARRPRRHRASCTGERRPAAHVAALVAARPARALDRRRRDRARARRRHRAGRGARAAPSRGACARPTPASPRLRAHDLRVTLPEGARAAGGLAASRRARDAGR